MGVLFWSIESGSQLATFFKIVMYTEHVMSGFLCFVIETQTEAVVILDEGQGMAEVDCEEKGMEIDEEPEEGEGDPIDEEGDPDWTPEEAEDAYKQAGDDNGYNQPNPKYGSYNF